MPHGTWRALGYPLQSPIPGFQFPTFVGPFTILDARVTGSQTVFDFSSIRRYQASKLGVAAAKSDIDNYRGDRWRRQWRGRTWRR